jgi:crossover junction endodeoxyribonuclease RuvC
MLSIGIDPGTAITGYGLVRENEDGSLTVVDYGAILTGADQLNDILHLHRPDNGAVEKLFFARNVRTALTVGQARGVVLLALEKACVTLSEYTPLEVKQSVAGYGGADKHQVQQMVKALLGLEAIPQPDDAADALAIAICHVHSARLKGMIPDG